MLILKQDVKLRDWGEVMILKPNECRKLWRDEGGKFRYSRKTNAPKWGHIHPG